VNWSGDFHHRSIFARPVTTGLRFQITVLTLGPEPVKTRDEERAYGDRQCRGWYLRDSLEQSESKSWGREQSEDAFDRPGEVRKISKTPDLLRRGVRWAGTGGCVDLCAQAIDRYADTADTAG